MKRHQVTEYVCHDPRMHARPLRFAILSDVHNGEWKDIRPFMEQADAILIPGDIVNRHAQGIRNAQELIEQAPDIAPTFFSIGNHERKARDMEALWPVIRHSRMTILDNTFVSFQGIVLGGLSSREIHTQGENGRKKAVRTEVVDRMAQQDGFKLLMCHHPEYYFRYVRGHGIDLTISGHAHGGQIQIAGHGLYAPGQGVFPRWTHGFYDDGHLLVSRGMTNSARAPRLWNPLELVMLTLTE